MSKLMEQTNYFIEGLNTKNEKIILEIYRDVFPKVKGFVINNSGQRFDAEDIFQNSLLQIVVRYNKKPFKIKTSFEAYLFTVCKNLWRRELNKSRRWATNERIIQQLSKEEDMAIAVIEQEQWELFNECFNMLSGNCKKVLRMFFNKISYSQIVKEMGYNSETVARQRVFKCKKKLKRLIKNDKRYKNLVGDEYRR